MRRRLAACVLVGVALLLGAASVMAADKINKTSVTVFAPVVVSGKTLAPGDYQVTWQANGDQAQVTILLNKKVVASASAKIEARGTAYSDTTLVTTQKGDVADVTEIRPGGLKQALVLVAATP